MQTHPEDRGRLLRRLLTLQQLAEYDEFKRHLATCRSPDEALEHTLHTAINVAGAQFGNIQILDLATRTLTICAQRGFGLDFLDAFRTVSIDDGTACGRALRDNVAVIVPDVEHDPTFAPYRALAAAAGFRAVQSTPMVSSDGKIVGVISTHFRDPHTPARLEMRVVRLYGRCLADAIVGRYPEMAALRATSLRSLAKGPTA
ncbi:MAG TPA: GAF domain-containing protein [Alphaproteobacteria bacterium]|nr:GAF domain-containing protein [Alphaproteobacteria bacterium]